MLRDNLVGLIEPMLSSAGANPLALPNARKKPSDDRPPCLENPRPEGAKLTLTENAASPFHAEPRQNLHPFLFYTTKLTLLDHSDYLNSLAKPRIICPQSESTIPVNILVNQRRASVKSDLCGPGGTGFSSDKCAIVLFVQSSA
jgi:hypothetical protein